MHACDRMPEWQRRSVRVHVMMCGHSVLCLRDVGVDLLYFSI